MTGIDGYLASGVKNYSPKFENDCLLVSKNPKPIETSLCTKDGNSH